MHVRQMPQSTPSTKRSAILGIAVVTLAVVLTGCGKIAEKATEKATEKILESASGLEDVDIDTDSGEITIKGSDGEEMKFSGDEETFTMSDGEGNEYSAGGSETTAPDWFPSYVWLPDSYTVLASMRSTEGDTTTYSVTLALETSPEDAFEAFKDEMVGGDWEIDFENQSTSSGSSQFMANLKNGDDGIMITASDSYTDEGTTTVSLIVSEAVG